MRPEPAPLHVSLVATPDAQVSPLSGIFETLSAFGLLEKFEPGVPRRPFVVEIVAGSTEPTIGASGLPFSAHRSYEEIDQTDIAIVPLMMVEGPDWIRGRFPGLVGWLRAMHDRGATLCSACTGVLLLAETGLLDGREATIHWAFAPTFRRNFPNVRLRTEEVLITAGERSEFVMTGGVMSWHDLVLHLIARKIGPTAAHAMARLLMLQWHGEGQAPYSTFAPVMSHGDALVLRLQQWLEKHYMIANPVEEMARAAGMPRRSMERRFSRATGLSPIAYVQAQRIEEAKRQLERTMKPIDEISYDVGYENAAFFRRLFKRKINLTPGAYRRKFEMPRVQT
ncbi:GlxA family transcriptional regulator [Nitratireductor luteus]|uniref:GlxA family transcriptional regulator n=1 Tax=Nitratireductor luteus TaxID=2976980 RepID=UPI00223EC165|nr:helix-turn-helix domain-containing protein [Nitratireductor luteus]